MASLPSWRLPRPLAPSSTNSLYYACHQNQAAALRERKVYSTILNIRYTRREAITTVSCEHCHNNPFPPPTPTDQDEKQTPPNTGEIAQHEHACLVYSTSTTGKWSTPAQQALLLENVAAQRMAFARGPCCAMYLTEFPSFCSQPSFLPRTYSCTMVSTVALRNDKNNYHADA